MMNRCLMVAAAALVPSSALAWETKVLARSIPSHCEFVYEVESDFIFTLDVPNVRSASLVYGYEDAYGKSGTWNREGARALVRAPEGNFQTTFSEETFSVSAPYLFREMNFHFNLILDDGTATQLPRKGNFHIAFGREFGEPCLARPEAPFLERAITLKEGT